MTRMTASIAAALVAAAGLASPVAAQNTITSTTIKGSDQNFEGTSTRVIDGVEYTIEFGSEGVHSAFIDGEEAEFKVDADVVLIKGDDGVVRMDVPALVPGGARGFNLPPRGAAQWGVGGDVVEGRDFTWGVWDEPKTMVGLTQSSIEDQLRAHLEIEEGVGTMILSVVGGLPADEAGMRAGDVLIAVNGREVTGSDVLTDELADLDAGDDLDVIILRKGLPETLTIKVAKFDPQKLYGERFPGGMNLRGNVGGIQRLQLGEMGQNRFDIDVEFDEFEDFLRDQLAELDELEGERDEELEEALAMARERLVQALEQADRARGFRFDLDGNNELLIRRGEEANERAILIERQARNARARDLEEAAADLRERNRELLKQNQELQERLKALEVRMDRMLDLLEERGEQ